MDCNVLFLNVLFKKFFFTRVKKIEKDYEL